MAERRAPLTKERVLQAAVELADRDDRRAEHAEARPGAQCRPDGPVPTRSKQGRPHRWHVDAVIAEIEIPAPQRRLEGWMRNMDLPRRARCSATRGRRQSWTGRRWARRPSPHRRGLGDGRRGGFSVGMAHHRSTSSAAGSSASPRTRSRTRPTLRRPLRTSQLPHSRGAWRIGFLAPRRSGDVGAARWSARTAATTTSSSNSVST